MLASLPVLAQQPPESGGQGSGSVTGHVYCADTNKPARFARVTIESVEDLRAVEIDKEGKLAPRKPATATLEETGLDGSYLIQNLPPGRYYILAELPGYLTPLMGSTLEDLNSPSKEDEERFRTEMEQVTVANNQTSRMDFRLEKGAAISGRVQYDDGGAIPGARVSLLRKSKDGTWSPVSMDRYEHAPETDDQGYYRIPMLSAGEYLVTVDLRRITMSTTNQAMPIVQTYRAMPSGTRIYSGDTPRKADAKSIWLRRGEERTGADIIVPISKLYTISGTVVAKSDGHAINGGTISLEDPIDGSTVKQTGIRETRVFTMDFVPAGQYVLKVSSAVDGVMETEQLKGTKVTHAWLKPLHTYSDTEQPLDVHGDISGITLTVIDHDTSSSSIRSKPSD